MFDLSGKTALVTGSTQGIGFAIAKCLHEAGATVWVHGATSEEKTRRAAQAIGCGHFVVKDLADPDAAEVIHAATGDVDLLVLNASVQYKEKWDEITEETFDRQITVNLKSTLLLMQAYAPAMKSKGFGRIVTVGSVNQYRRHPELPLYAATKCAVFSLVQNVAKQLAPFGVTVNNVAPGAIATPRNADVYNDPERRRAVESSIPMGRFGVPEDCVGAILLLCSNEGAYVTGSDFIVDGGLRL